MKAEIRYFRFTENNDHEGESWDFYIPLKKPQFDKLATLIGGYECYELSSRPYTEEEVDSFLKTRCNTGYMSNINKCSSKFKLPKEIDWDKDDPFYKGQLWEVIASN